MIDWLVVWNQNFMTFPSCWAWKITPTDELTPSFFGVAKNHKPDIWFHLPLGQLISTKQWDTWSMSVAAVVRAQVIAPLTECLSRALKAATRNGQRRNGETTHEDNRNENGMDQMPSNICGVVGKPFAVNPRMALLLTTPEPVPLFRFGAKKNMLVNHSENPKTLDLFHFFG